MRDITKEPWERVGGRVFVTDAKLGKDRLVAEVYAPSRRRTLSANAVAELERIGDLIAAAPTMAAVLTMVEEHLTELIAASHITDSSSEALLARVRAALLSARGGA